MPGADAGLQLCDHIDQPGNVVFAHACQLGCEGIVSKRLGSRYQPGPTKCPDLDQGEEPSGAGGEALKDAIAAEIIRWDGNSIGVAYTYKNEDHQMHQLGTEDRTARSGRGMESMTAHPQWPHTDGARPQPNRCINQTDIARFRAGRFSFRLIASTQSASAGAD
jgi:hypothetical protein